MIDRAKAIVKGFLLRTGLWQQPSRARTLTHYKRRQVAAIRRHGPRTAAFTPQTPDSRTAAWKICHLLGFRICNDSRGDVLLAWDDATWSEPVVGAINGRCIDISKSRVAEAQLHIFGYSAEVDPETFSGDCVVKSEINTAHNGRVVRAPVARDDGVVYQLLIDNETRPGVVEDHRVPIVGGDIPLVYRKYRATQHRFQNRNERCEVASPSECFTADELKRLSAVAHHLGLDFGEIDVLRHRADARIYVIDVNKTPWGPPSGIDLDAGRQTMHQIAASFARAFIRYPR